MNQNHFDDIIDLPPYISSSCFQEPHLSSTSLRLKGVKLTQMDGQGMLYTVCVSVLCMCAKEEEEG